MTVTIIVGIVIGMLIVGGIFAAKEAHSYSKLKESLNDQTFESEDGRVRYRIKNYRVDYIVVDGNRYDSFDAVLSKERLTKSEHEQIMTVKKMLDKQRKEIAAQWIEPPAYTEFKDTPVGDLRIYNEGPVRLSPRCMVILGKDKEGQMIVGRAIISKKDLLTDSYRQDFMLFTTDEDMQDEVDAHYTGFEVNFLNNKEYADEVEVYKQISDALERYNANKDKFEVKYGKLVFKGNAMKAATRPALPPTGDAARDEVEEYLCKSVAHR